MPTRIFQEADLQTNETILLDKAASHHLVNVLRVKKNDSIILFNGKGGSYIGQIIDIIHKQIKAKIGEHTFDNIESPLNIHLGQGISRSDKMNFTIQKAVELGVSIITPLLTEKSNIRLDKTRLEKKHLQWQQIAIHACEQCGRNSIPKIRHATTIEEWLEKSKFINAFVLDPTGSTSLKKALRGKSITETTLLIGPEAGLTPAEITQATKARFTSIILGPRILRTETAGLAAISALQCLEGDMG